MTNPRIAIFNSLDELELHRERWNDLWQRSDVTVPTVRLEFLRVWLEAFAAGQEFRAIVVDSEGNRIALHST